MKKFLSITALLAVFFISDIRANNPYSFNNLTPGVSNDTVTVSFSVNGTASCKSNIESTLTSNAGVVSANWDATAKVVTVIYLTSKIKKSDLYTFLATAGYDNAELRAKAAAYAALPQACQYTRDPDTE